MEEYAVPRRRPSESGNGLVGRYGLGRVASTLSCSCWGWRSASSGPFLDLEDITFCIEKAAPRTTGLGVASDLGNGLHAASDQLASSGLDVLDHVTHLATNPVGFRILASLKYLQ